MAHQRSPSTWRASAIAPFDVSDVALFVDDTWREPFAKLRAEMPVSWCAESPYGGYWSVVTHDMISAVELDPGTYSSSWENGNIVIADPAPESNLQNFIAADPPVHTEQRKVIAPAFAPSQMATREAQVREEPLSPPSLPWPRECACAFFAC